VSAGVLACGYRLSSASPRWSSTTPALGGPSFVRYQAIAPTDRMQAAL
jgi:hypothetical protein